MDELDKKIDEDRFHKVYEQLVDETENPATLHNRRKNQLLKDMLELFEYLRGEEFQNPLELWFDE